MKLQEYVVPEDLIGVLQEVSPEMCRHLIDTAILRRYTLLTLLRHLDYDKYSIYKEKLDKIRNNPYKPIYERLDDYMKEPFDDLKDMVYEGIQEQKEYWDNFNAGIAQ